MTNHVAMTDAELREFAKLSPDTNAVWQHITDQERERWLSYRRAADAGLFNDRHDPDTCADCGARARVKAGEWTA